MVIKIAAIVNRNSRVNKKKKYEATAAEVETIQEKLSECCLVSVDRPNKPDLVTLICNRYIQQNIDVVIISGGDGTLQNFVTHQFRELYRRFGKGAPIEFAHTLNALALERTDLGILPALYHRRRGTVNVYADTLEMEGDLESIAENIYDADRKLPQMGRNAFRRVYVPMLMQYSKDSPGDLDSMHIMAMYADGFIYKFYEKYYEPKERGKDPSIKTALRIMGRASISATAATAIDKSSTMLTGSDGFGRALYENRYVDELMKNIPCKIIADGKDLDCKERSATVLSTIGASLYGLKPFWRMPKNPGEFMTRFKHLEKETMSKLQPTFEEAQLLCGEIQSTEVVKAIQKIYRGKATNMKGLTDRFTKKVEIEQDMPLSFIADGTRYENGRRTVIEIAYLQPFILLDRRPME